MITTTFLGVPPAPARVRLLLLVLPLLLALVLPSASSAGKKPPPPTTVSAYGLNALRAEWLADFPVGVEDLGRMGGAKIGMYRARFRQDQVLSNGTYSNWARLDNLAKQASLQGVTLV